MSEQLSSIGLLALVVADFLFAHFNVGDTTLQRQTVNSTQRAHSISCYVILILVDFVVADLCARLKDWRDGITPEPPRAHHHHHQRQHRRRGFLPGATSSLWSLDLRSVTSYTNYASSTSDQPSTTASTRRAKEVSALREAALSFAATFFVLIAALQHIAQLNRAFAARSRGDDDD